MIVQKSSQNVNSNAGVFLAKQLLDRMGGFSRFDGWQKAARSVPCQRYSNSSLVKAQVALMALGKTTFSDIAAHQRDDLFADAICGDVPSEPTFRQRLGVIAAIPGVRDVVDDLNLDLLRRAKDFGTVRTPGGTYMPLDMDVSVLVNDDCRKERVGFTYHKVNGYAPIFATLGTNGFQLANELRPGGQHSQKDFIPFFQRAVGMASLLTPERLLVRLDSGHDSDDTVRAGFELDDFLSAMSPSCPGTPDGLAFIVKRNPRGESAGRWLEQAKGNSDGPSEAYRNDKRGADVSVWRGVVSHVKTKSTQDRPLFCVYEVVETKADDMLLPDVEVSLWWTNLPDDADTVVRLYHEHGTHEQFHSELKTDLDVERLPSGSFAVNELVLALSTLSFNILRIIGQTALEVRGETGGVSRLRLRTVLLNYIYVGAICGSHGGRRYLRLGRNCHVADVFMAIGARLAA